MAKDFGLDNLLKSTENVQGVKEKDVTPTKKRADKKSKVSEEKDVKIINSNIPLTAEHHWKLRRLALEKQTTLRVLLQDIVASYLEHHNE